MRSVYLIFEESKQDAIIRFFERYCSYCNEYSGGSKKQFFVLDNDDPCLNIYPIDVDDLEIEDEDTLKILIDIDINVVVWEIDISRRHDGRKELYELIIQLFSVESGYAKDDDSDHFWTIEEIQNKKLIEGRTFFNF